jgi:FMN phosphatase YigB (HAD superfamily)
MSIFLNRNKIDFVFVDWFGVLSTNYYWCIQSQKSKLLKEWCDCVFDDADVLNEWMRGKYNLRYLTEFRVKVNEDFITETFLKDIEHYKPDRVLLESLNNLFPNSKKILVTDNMSLFEHILKEYDYLNSYFYKIYLSHEIGLLKNDKPTSLFDFILKDLGRNDFRNCLLIDDHQANCQNFKERGGRTVLVG